MLGAADVDGSLDRFSLGLLLGLPVGTELGTSLPNIEGR